MSDHSVVIRIHHWCTEEEDLSPWQITGNTYLYPLDILGLPEPSGLSSRHQPDPLQRTHDLQVTETLISGHRKDHVIITIHSYCSYQ